MLDAFLALAEWQNLLFLAIGTGLGIVVGAIPGLTASMLIALTLPLTFHMDPVSAVTLLIGEYVGGISGGLITAILLRMPGTPASIVTTFDGYPMAQNGFAERALALGIMASVVGGIISWGFLAGMSPALARFALQFGPWEYFTLVLMALVMLAVLSQGSMVKGLMAAALGMAFALPGIDSSIGQARLTFGSSAMLSGFGLLPVLIGAFAISQILRDAATPQESGRMDMPKSKLPIYRSDLGYAPKLLRGSVIGTWIGLLPGIGANIAALVSYSTEKQLSKEPEKFGTGHEPGVVAAESANNASIGGALIPLMHDIVQRHGITRGNIVGHSDVAPARKQDPGELFPWGQLARLRLALPRPTRNLMDPLWTDSAFMLALERFGYDIAEPEAAVVAFQRRFRPELIDGVIDGECRAILLALLLPKPRGDE